MLPGMRARRPGGAPACAADQGVCRSVAASNSATWLAAVASAMTLPSGPKAAAVSGAPSCAIVKAPRHWHRHELLLSCSLECAGPGYGLTFQLCSTPSVLPSKRNTQGPSTHCNKPQQCCGWSFRSSEEPGTRPSAR